MEMEPLAAAEAAQRIEPFAIARRVDTRSYDEHRFLCERRVEALKLLHDHAIILRRITLIFCCVNKMQKHASALDVAEEAIAQSAADMRAFDQARNIRHDE